MLQNLQLQISEHVGFGVGVVGLYYAPHPALTLPMLITSNAIKCSISNICAITCLNWVLTWLSSLNWVVVKFLKVIQLNIQNKVLEMFLSTKSISFLSVVCFLCQQWPQEHLTSITKELQNQEGLSGLARHLCPMVWAQFLVFTTGWWLISEHGQETARKQQVGRLQLYNLPTEDASCTAPRVALPSQQKGHLCQGHRVHVACHLTSLPPKDSLWYTFAHSGWWHRQYPWKVSQKTANAGGSGGEHGVPGGQGGRHFTVCSFVHSVVWSCNCTTYSKQ